MSNDKLLRKEAKKFFRENFDGISDVNVLIKTKEQYEKKIQTPDYLNTVDYYVFLLLTSKIDKLKFVARNKNNENFALF